MDLSLDTLLGSIKSGAAVPAVRVADLRTVLRIMSSVDEPHQESVGFDAEFIQAIAVPKPMFPHYGSAQPCCKLRASRAS